jgi:bacterioferritin
MKGKPKIIDLLNEVLCRELTAINQYFLHARMLQNWGLTHLGHLEYKASVDEMKHADSVIKRILFLEGLPNMQKYHKVTIGETVPEVLECDLKLEYEAIEVLKNCVATSETERDFISRDLFNDILASEEAHIEWLETQLELIKSLGLQNYMQTAVGGSLEEN